MPPDNAIPVEDWAEAALSGIAVLALRESEVDETAEAELGETLVGALSASVADEVAKLASKGIVVELDRGTNSAKNRVDSDDI